MSGSINSNGSIVPNITFNQIPTPWYVPGAYVEIRPNFANAGILPFPARNLIIAQMTAAGTAPPGSLQQNIVQPQQATALFGPGSHAEAAVIAYLATNTDIPLDVIGISDAAGATKAAWTATVGGSWTLGGTTAIGIAGVRLATGTLSSDTFTTTATELAALVNGNPQLPVIATSALGVVTLTAKNGGLAANDISVLVSPAVGDALVPGMTLAVAQTTPGATNPSISAAISAITGLWYTGIAMYFQDTPNIGLLTAELARRYNAMTQEDCIGYMMLTGTYSQQITAVQGINSPYVAALGMTTPGSPPWAYCASMLGTVGQSLMQDPSLQVGSLALPGMVGPPRSVMLTSTELEMMLAAKGSTYNVLMDGTVTINRLVSAYLSNVQGVSDVNTYFDINEVAVGTRIRYDWRTYFQLVYPTNKLAADGGLAAEYNTNVCTPHRAQGSWANRMTVYAQNGWIQNEAADIAAAVFKIDANDPNRLDYQVQYTRIGNLFVSAGVLMFNAQ